MNANIADLGYAVRLVLAVPAQRKAEPDKAAALTFMRQVIRCLKVLYPCQGKHYSPEQPESVCPCCMELAFYAKAFWKTCIAFAPIEEAYEDEEEAIAAAKTEAEAQKVREVIDEHWDAELDLVRTIKRLRVGQTMFDDYDESI